MTYLSLRCLRLCGYPPNVITPRRIAIGKPLSFKNTIVLYCLQQVNTLVPLRGSQKSLADP